MSNFENKLDRMEYDFNRMNRLMEMIVQMRADDPRRGERERILRLLEKCSLEHKRVSEQYRNKFVYRRWERYNSIPTLELPASLPQGLLDCYGYPEFQEERSISFRDTYR